MKKTNLGIDWDKENLQTIRLAQDFIKNQLTYCVSLPVNNSISRQPSLINSDREIIPVNALSLESKLSVKVADRYIDPIYKKIDAPEEYMRWSINSSEYSIRQFVESDKSISTAEVFMEVREVFSDFIWTSPEDSGNHTILALYIMLTYVFQIFDAISYLNLWGTKASGKSQTLTLLYKLAFNAVMGSSVTAAAQFRLTEKYCNTLLLDEHPLSASSKNTDGDLLHILNSGYKKEGAAVRCEGEEFKPASYITFSPKIIAGTEELPSQLLDRCILIDTERMPNTSLSSLKLKEYNSRAEEKRFQLLVDKLHYWGLEWAPKLARVYDSYHNQDIPQLRGRDRELWLCLFVIGKLIDSSSSSVDVSEEIGQSGKSLQTVVLELAKQNKEMRDQLDREDERDRQLLMSVFDFRDHPQNHLDLWSEWFVARDLTDHIKEALNYSRLAPNTVRAKLIKLRVMEGTADSHKSINIDGKTKTCYLISLERLLKVARKYGIDTVELGYPNEGEQKTTSIKEDKDGGKEKEENNNEDSRSDGSKTKKPGKPDFAAIVKEHLGVSQNNENNQSDNNEESDEQLNELLGGYKKPDIIENYLNLFKVDNPKSKGEYIPTDMKIAILRELKSDIKEIIQKGVLYDEVTLYSTIKELMLSILNTRVFLNPEAVGERNHVLIASLKKQSDDSRIESVKNKINKESLRSEIERRIRNLSNQNDSPEK